MVSRGLVRAALAVIAGLALVFTAAVPQAVALPPLGYQLMCLQHPSECKAGGAPKVAVSRDEMATLREVNTYFNRAIRPRNDAAGTDVWTVDARVGDCEDYALAKRDALIRAGFSRSALRLAYVKTRWGEGHAVLVVKTTRGDLVLDNLTGLIKPLSQSGLRLISIASANPLKWS